MSGRKPTPASRSNPEDIRIDLIPTIMNLHYSTSVHLNRFHSILGLLKDSDSK